MGIGTTPGFTGYAVCAASRLRCLRDQPTRLTPKPVSRMAPGAGITSGWYSHKTAYGPPRHRDMRLRQCCRLSRWRMRMMRSSPSVGGCASQRSFPPYQTIGERGLDFPSHFPGRCRPAGRRRHPGPVRCRIRWDLGQHNLPPYPSKARRADCLLSRFPCPSLLVGRLRSLQHWIR
jgi:hypothetical protein